MDTKGGKLWWGGDGGVLNWAIGIDMYTLMCIKLMPNKNLQYKKQTNKTKQNKKIELKKNLETINVGDVVEKREPSCTVDGNVN